MGSIRKEVGPDRETIEEPTKPMIGMWFQISIDISSIAEISCLSPMMIASWISMVGIVWFWDVVFQCCSNWSILKVVSYIRRLFVENEATILYLIRRPKTTWWIIFNSLTRLLTFII